MIEKQLIVNGNINPSLTLEEILENFNADDFLNLAWRITCNINNCFSHAGDQPSRSEIGGDPRNMLIKQWSLLKSLEADKLKSDQAREFQEGVQFYEFVASISSPKQHTIELTTHQALGFLSKQSSWNEYDPKKIAKAIEKVAALGLYLDYGVNNPNTGRNIISWASNGEYWFLRVERSAASPSKVTEDAHQTVLTILGHAGSEVVRFEDDEYERTYVMWWD